jgi:hypothetical protein
MLSTGNLGGRRALAVRFFLVERFGTRKRKEADYREFWRHKVESAEMQLWQSRFDWLRSLLRRRNAHDKSSG